MIHQTHNTTELNRYPDIFKCVSDLYINPISILSFGCSTGEECITLQNYFPESNIIGVDISEAVLQEARQKCKNVTFYTDANRNIKVDIIFAMSVFCKHPESADLERNTIYPFQDFDNAIISLDKILNVNGLFVVYNSNYFFSDTQVANKYDSITAPLRLEFVRKFDKMGLYSKIESPLIFRKMAI